MIPAYIGGETESIYHERIPGNKVEVDLPTLVDHISRAPAYEERV